MRAGRRNLIQMRAWPSCMGVRFNEPYLLYIIRMGKRVAHPTLSYGCALPPETGIAELLPEPAVLHIVEVPPLHVPIDEKDISAGGIRA